MKNQLIETILHRAKILRYSGDQASARKILEPFRYSNGEKAVSEAHIASELAYADTFIRESRFIQAGRHSSNALLLAEKANNKNLSQRAKLLLAKILFHQKDFKNALDLLNQILKECRKNEFNEIKAQSIGLIGEIKCIDKRNFEESKRLHEESLSLFEEINDDYGIADQKSNLARVYFNLNDIPVAYHYFQDSLEQFKKIGDKNQVAIQINNIAIVYARALRFQSAIDLFKKALKTREEIGDYAGMANIQENIAHIYHFSLKNHKLAIKWYKRSIESLEFIRHRIAGSYQQQQNYIGEFFEVYQKLVELLCQLYFEQQSKKLFNEILQYTERAKASVLLSTVENIDFVNIDKKKFDAETNEKVARLQREIDSLSNEILQNIIDEHEDKNTKIIGKKIEKEKELSIIKLSFVLRNNNLDLLQPANIPSLEQLQNNILENGEVLLSYYVTLFNVYCLEISTTSYALYKAGKVDKLNQLLQTYTEEIQNYPNLNHKRYITINHQLWHFLTLNGKFITDRTQTYVILPDAAISHVAFEGLTTTNNLKYPQYLGSDFRILYYPSVSFFVAKWAKSRLSIQQDYSLNFLGLAVLSSAPFDKLDTPVREVELNKKLFYKDSQILLTDNDTTKENFKAQLQKSILLIHIATHGITHSDQLRKYGLEEPALVFSRGESGKENPFLSISEIFDLKINAKLVILSACQTGTGKSLRGEGINSLARAFIGAGAQCVLATLWQVRDDVCLDFMSEFYKGLKSKSILDAFFEAKQKTRKLYSNPGDWAAFIIVGNGHQKLSQDIHGLD